MASSTQAFLDQARQLLQAPETLDADLTEAEIIDEMQSSEKLVSALAALQARRAARLAQLRGAAEKARGIPKSRRCKGLAEEIALARGHAPARGAQHLAVALALFHHMPETLAALSDGRIQESHVQAVVREIEWLTPRDRRAVDQLISNDFEGVGPRQLGKIVREHTQRLDPKTANKRLAEAQKKRRVEIRPTDNNMAQLRATLPLPQAVAVFETLSKDARSALSSGQSKGPDGQQRTRDQLMADLLVERATGQASAEAVPTQINLIMTDDALFGDGDTPARLPGHGSIPAAAARAWLTNPEMKVFLRRVFTRPKDHQLVALESRSRYFPAGLRWMLRLRADICSTPYCEAVIQEADHREPDREGGKTTYDNGSAVCGGCNQRKENLGWSHHGDAESLTVKTPTEHEYTRRTRGLKPPEQLPDTTDPPDAPDDPPPPAYIDKMAHRHPGPPMITIPVQQRRNVA